MRELLRFSCQPSICKFPAFLASFVSLAHIFVDQLAHPLIKQLDTRLYFANLTIARILP